MLRIVLLSGLVMCAGSGFAAYRHFEPEASLPGMSQSAADFLSGAPSRLMTMLSGDGSKAEKPRVARLPQASGAYNRGNDPLAYRQMKATASAMVEASPTARAQRDAGMAAAQERRWSKLFRSSPEESAQEGRLSGIQDRARERAEQQEHLRKLLRSQGYNGEIPTLPEGMKLKSN